MSTNSDIHFQSDTDPALVLAMRRVRNAQQLGLHARAQTTLIARTFNPNGSIKNASDTK